MRLRTRKDSNRRAWQCIRLADRARRRTQAVFEVPVHRAGNLDCGASAG